MNCSVEDGLNLLWTARERKTGREVETWKWNGVGEFGLAGDSEFWRISLRL
jgi:hypothetical protein